MLVQRFSQRLAVGIALRGAGWAVIELRLGVVGEPIAGLNMEPEVCGWGEGLRRPSPGPEKICVRLVGLPASYQLNLLQLAWPATSIAITFVLKIWKAVVIQVCRRPGLNTAGSASITTAVVAYTGATDRSAMADKAQNAARNI